MPRFTGFFTAQIIAKAIIRSVQNDKQSVIASPCDASLNEFEFLSFRKI